MNQVKTQCSHVGERKGHIQQCSRPGTYFREDGWWCKMHLPDLPVKQWEGPQYRRIVKQGGTRTLAVGNVVPDDWAMVEMTWLCEGQGELTLKLRKLN